MANTIIRPNTGQLVLFRGSPSPTPLAGELGLVGNAPLVVIGTVLTPAPSPPTFVNSGKKTPPAADTGTVVAVTIPSTAEGDDLLGEIWLGEHSQAIPAVSDVAATGAAFALVQGGAVTKEVGARSARVELWRAERVPAGITTVTVTLASAGVFGAGVGEYASVADVGAVAVATGTAVPVTISVTTRDANNRVVAGFAAEDVAGALFTGASPGTLRESYYVFGPVPDVPGALVDNTAAAPSAVVNTVTTTVQDLWAAVAVELRGSGDLQLVGAAPAVVLGTVIRPSAGALAANGAAPTVTPSGGTALTPGVGALALEGLAPLIRLATLLTPAAGSLAVSGAAPDRIAGTVMVPGVGSLVLAEGTPSPVSGILRTPDPGSLIVSGVAHILEVDTRLTVASGSLLLSGEAPTIGGAIQITPGAGALVLAGQTAILGGAVQIVPGTGLLTLAGLEPRQDRGLFPGTGALALDGLAPSLRTDLRLTPAAGGLLLTGQTLQIGGGGPTVAGGAGLHADGPGAGLSPHRGARGDVAALGSRASSRWIARR